MSLPSFKNFEKVAEDRPLSVILDIVLLLTSGAWIGTYFGTDLFGLDLLKAIAFSICVSFPLSFANFLVLILIDRKIRDRAFEPGRVMVFSYLTIGVWIASLSIYSATAYLYLLRHLETNSELMPYIVIFLINALILVLWKCSDIHPTEKR